MNTPDQIDALDPGQVFVFGSNAAGHHAGGAARVALDRFGAVRGQGEGLQGDSYAIPTMGSRQEFTGAVTGFLAFAVEHPELLFLVTKVGTGIAGWPVSVVAPMFAGSPANVVLPVEFEVQS